MTVYIDVAAGGSLISDESIAALRRDAQAVAGQIEALAVQITEHEEAIAALRERRAALQGGLQKIESLISSASGKVSERVINTADTSALTYVAAARLPADVAPASVPRADEVRAAINGAQTLADQIEAVIRAANCPLHYKEILSRLHLENVAVGGKDPAATLLSILANKRYEGRFSRFERGVYTLCDLPRLEHSRARPSKRRRRRAVRKAS